MKTIITGTPYQETQNDRELKLLRMILANLVQIECENFNSIEQRALAIGRLEAMIEYKQIANN